MKTIIIMTVISAITLANPPFAQENKKTFKLSDKVTVEKVSYKNRYGIKVAADMYLPKNMDRSKKHAALIVGTPYGGVKEQGAGIYAQSVAERGFVAIAFEESSNGESGGGQSI